MAADQDPTLTLDEILVKLEKRRDHGPNDLHELVYQLAIVVRENLREARGADGKEAMTILDPAICVRLVAGARSAEKEWDAEAHDRGDTSESDGYESSDYVDGWNDAIEDHALPLAAQLEAALAEICRLRSELDSKDV